jgi:polyisoprenyl-teichoic acid--peptidoglycan teichoic acid transferase
MPRLAIGTLMAAVLVIAGTSGLVQKTDAQGDDDGKTTVLLIGADAGPERGGLRTDSMNVASIDRETGRAALFGVPRDMRYTPLPEPYASLFECGCWESLLNELYIYAEANPELFGGGPHPGGDVLMATLENLLGLDIDYFVLVDLPGFVRVIDALGGVTMDIPEQESILLSPAFEEDGWRQYVIPVGKQHLDGRTALAYSRTRLGSNDFDRMTRQRCLLGALARQADVGTLLTNYLDLVVGVQDAVVTDIPLEQLPGLIQLLDDVDFGTVYAIGFTTPDFVTQYLDQMRPVPNHAAIRQAVEAVFTAPTEEIQNTYGTLPGLCAWSQ